MTVPNFLSVVSPEDVRVLRNMRRALAVSWLKARYPDLTPDDMAEAVALAPEAVPAVPPMLVVSDPLRNLFVASAWLAGASINQLSSLFTLSRQRIMQVVHRAVPGDRAMRTSKRIGRDGMPVTVPSVEVVERWRDAFYAFAQDTGVEAVAAMDPQEVALILPDLPNNQPVEETTNAPRT